MKRGRILRIRFAYFSALVLGMLFLSEQVCATTPCPPPVCDATGKSPRARSCSSVAEWIAVGSITDIEHHRKGDPLNKDFAEFVLRIDRWEKGEVPGLKSLKLAVGWCVNQRPLPEKPEGQYRFFGLHRFVLTGSGIRTREYLDFQKVSFLDEE